MRRRDFDKLSQQPNPDTDRPFVERVLEEEPIILSTLSGRRLRTQRGFYRSSYGCVEDGLDTGDWCDDAHMLSFSTARP